MPVILRGQRLVVTAGAGGVGKTTAAAAIAVQAACAGLRTAVLTIDPARRLADALGLGELTGTLSQVDPAVLPEGAAALHAMMLDIRTTSDQMVQQFAPDAETAQAILSNKYYGYFSTSLSGSQEYMAVSQVSALVEDSRFDLVVLDTPPAANALEFLDAPDRLIEALDSRPMQMLRSNREKQGLSARILGRGKDMILRSLNVMTGGEFLEDLSEFLVVFGSILDALKDSSEAVRGMLRAPTTRFYLVTAPTRANVDEALHFRQTLKTRGLPFGGYIVNRVHVPVEPVADDAASVARLTDLSGLGAALIERLLHGHAQHNRTAKGDAKAIAKLAADAGRAPDVVPMLPLAVRDLDGLMTVGAHLIPPTR